MSDLLIPAIILAAFALGLAQLVASLILIGKLNQVFTSLSGKLSPVRRVAPAPLAQPSPPRPAEEPEALDAESLGPGAPDPEALDSAEAWLDAVGQGEGSALSGREASPASEAPTLAQTLLAERSGTAEKTEARRPPKRSRHLLFRLRRFVLRRVHPSFNLSKTRRRSRLRHLARRESGGSAMLLPLLSSKQRR